MSKPAREIPWLDLRRGVYNVCWYEPPTEEEKQRNPQAAGETRRVGLRTRDFTEATARFAAFLTTGYHKKVARGQLTVAGAIAQYLEEHVEVKVTDKDRAQKACEHLVKFFGDLPLPDIGIPECRAYTNTRGQEVSGSTIRRELVVLRAAANHALRWKRISKAQVPTFELPPESDDGQQAPWFSKEELERLVWRAEGPLRDFVVLTYWWGARKASVEDLEIRQVQLDRGLVNLQKAGEQVTKKRRPIVPIFPTQRETLERLVSVAGGEAGNGWLFGRGYESYRPFNALCKACGLEEGRRHPHLLRHSRATHMLMDGESIYKVGKLLGDTVKTVETVYGHYSPEFLAS